MRPFERREPTAASSRNAVIHVGLSKGQLCGTNRTCAGAAIAHTESPRICGMTVAALQLMSPKRSLKPATRYRNQTALSLRSALTIDTRSLRLFDTNPIHALAYQGRHQSIFVYRLNCGSLSKGQTCSGSGCLPHRHALGHPSH